MKHGKGPSDKAGGNFKRTIQAAVKGGHELLHANAIEEYCKVNFDWQELCPGDVTNGAEQHDENQQCDEQKSTNGYKRVSAQEQEGSDDGGQTFIQS